MHRKLILLLMAAAMASSCSGDRDARLPAEKAAELSPPDPILASDRVKDARTAIRLGVARCFPREAEVSFQAELQSDRWFVWADFKNRAFSAEVAKSDGTVMNCTDLEI